METRAPFVIVGAFVLAAIAAVFGFVYWLNNAGGIGKRETYQIVFNGPVPGLLVGAAVLFNGIRVGEVTSLELVADRPHDVHATIAVEEHTPIRSDTKVGLDFQGLTGVPVVALSSVSKGRGYAQGAFAVLFMLPWLVSWIFVKLTRTPWPKLLSIPALIESVGFGSCGVTL